MEVSVPRGGSRWRDDRLPPQSQARLRCGAAFPGRGHGIARLEKITIDKSGANTAAIESYNAEYCSDIELRECKYLNNIVEQDHRAIKRIVRPMLGFKVFRCARILITGIETMHMIRKGQLDGHDGEVLSAADRFYSLAF